MGCSFRTAENNNRQSEKKEILTNNQYKYIIQWNIEKNYIFFIHEGNLYWDWSVSENPVMNKTLQIFAAFAIFQDELVARLTLKAFFLQLIGYLIVIRKCLNAF